MTLTSILDFIRTYSSTNVFRTYAPHLEGGALVLFFAWVKWPSHMLLSLAVYLAVWTLKQYVWNAYFEIPTPSAESIKQGYLGYIYGIVLAGVLWLWFKYL